MAAVDCDTRHNDVASTDFLNHAPGTVMLESASSALKHSKTDRELILYPQPSSDPNDPLNWTMKRKIVNFSIASFYVLMVFAMLDIGVVVFQDYNTLLHISYSDLNNTFAANCVGLAFGCLLFVPFAIKYGRRPAYLVTTFVLFICGIWQAVLRDYPNMVAVQVVDGLAGSVADTIVQMTINDLFFLHQRGRMNASYLACMNIGVYLAPVVAGYSAVAQGWPWIYWWCAILLGVNFLLFVFFYEETKYVVTLAGVVTSGPTPTTPRQADPEEGPLEDFKNAGTSAAASTTEPVVAAPIPLKSYRQRLALVTKTPGTFADFARHFYQPLLMLTIPGVLYVALQFGAFLSWVSVVAVTESDYFSESPYNFSTIGIGLLNLPPFIGALISILYSGPLSDWSIIKLAKRNGGIYEPEMRLYPTIIPALLGPAGIFLYGFSLAHEAHWIVPCVGVGLYGFSQASIQALSLSYLMDSYEQILGDALIGVTFVRNAIAAGFVFATGPWIDSLGLYNTFVSLGCLALFFSLLSFVMIFWGKKMRIMCAKRYAAYAKTQPKRNRV